MDNSKYEATLKAVQATCPELMKLTDGCRVRITSGAFDGKIFTFQKDSLRKMYDEFWTDGDSCGACAFSENEFEILGHPIRLSHVLRAIGKLTSEKSVHSMSVEIDNANIAYLHFFSEDYNGKREEVCCSSYDLTKDDLSLQSPDTIDFLFNILCE